MIITLVASTELNCKDTWLRNRKGTPWTIAKKLESSNPHDLKDLRQSAAQMLNYRDTPEQSCYSMNHMVPRLGSGVLDRLRFKKKKEEGVRTFNPTQPNVPQIHKVFYFPERKAVSDGLWHRPVLAGSQRKTSKQTCWNNVEEPQRLRTKTGKTLENSKQTKTTNLP